MQVRCILEPQICDVIIHDLIMNVSNNAHKTKSQESWGECKLKDHHEGKSEIRLRELLTSWSSCKVLKGHNKKSLECYAQFQCSWDQCKERKSCKGKRQKSYTRKIHVLNLNAYNWIHKSHLEGIPQLNYLSNTTLYKHLKKCKLPT